MLSRRYSARDNKLGLLNLNDVAALVYRPAEKNDCAATRSRARRQNFNDLAFNMEHIARAGWCWPAQFSSSPNDAAGEWRTTLNI